MGSEMCIRDSLILFRLNRDRVQNLKIVGVLYGLGVFWGIIIEFAGIVF